jgi:hypothetical protein
MDDYSVAAPGFAWAAAYERMVNGSLLSQLIDAAHFMIDKSFDTTQSICIVPTAVANNRMPQDMASTNSRGPCTATASSSTTPNLQAGSARTLSLNHSHETPAYGYGLMTSISSAVLGLNLSGSSHNFSADEKQIAVSLAVEADNVTDPITPPPSDHQFRNRPTVNDREACLQIVPTDSTGNPATFPSAPDFEITAPLNPAGNCADLGYYPRMYPVGNFYHDWRLPGLGPEDGAHGRANAPRAHSCVPHGWHPACPGQLYSALEQRSGCSAALSMVAGYLYHLLQSLALWRCRAGELYAVW